MPLFCRICNNLMVVDTTADTFNFKCSKCFRVEDSQSEDSLRYEEASGINFTSYGAILRNAGRDPVNPKVAKSCNKCGSKIARQVRLGNEMRLINTCIKCGEQWLDGTRETENEIV
jgi:DNA-directed RNA polymerase subunit M/transcription elongation factor TFIIS